MVWLPGWRERTTGIRGEFHACIKNFVKEKRLEKGKPSAAESKRTAVTLRIF
jgi:hypothetical protein